VHRNEGYTASEGQGQMVQRDLRDLDVEFHKASKGGGEGRQGSCSPPPQEGAGFSEATGRHQRLEAEPRQDLLRAGEGNF
jgi:hypothetical protein